MFVPSQENNLRLLHVPIAIKNGKVHLTQNYTVCEKGAILKPENAKLLEHLGYKMAKFSLTLISHYTKEDGLKHLIEEG